jgi:hypothetical protein
MPENSTINQTWGRSPDLRRKSDRIPSSIGCKEEIRDQQNVIKQKTSFLENMAAEKHNTLRIGGIIPMMIEPENNDNLTTFCRN